MESKYGFHLVHDTQTVFRALLDATANPGREQEAKAQVARLKGASNGMELAIALTLLDNEVTFFERDGALSEEIAFLTRARPEPLHWADLVFVGEGEDPDAVLPYVKSGTLERPDDSATVFVRVDENGESLCAALTGPGIPPESDSFDLPAAATRWLRARQALAIEYPRGVDLVFFTAEGRFLALPRLTQIREGETSWLM